MKVIKFTKVNKVNKLNLEQFAHTPYSLQTLHYEDIIQGWKPHHIISSADFTMQCRTDGWCRRREQGSNSNKKRALKCLLIITAKTQTKNKASTKHASDVWHYWKLYNAPRICLLTAFAFKIQSSYVIVQALS